MSKPKLMLANVNATGYILRQAPFIAPALSSLRARFLCLRRGPTGSSLKAATTS